MAQPVSNFLATRSEFARRWGALFVALCFAQMLLLPVLLPSNRTFANVGNQFFWSLLAILIVMPAGLAVDRFRGGRWLMLLLLFVAVGALVYAWVATPPMPD